MPVQHTNRKAKTYYLHQGATKTGKPKYYFSMQPEGPIAETIPDGFEIYENPNAQVFLRKISRQIITDAELAVVKQGMQRFSQVKHFTIDVKKNVITIFLPDQDFGPLAQHFPFASLLDKARLEQTLSRIFSYSPMMQFVLLDEDERTFCTQRYCFRGSIDDWVFIGSSGDLQNLVGTYVKHLGQDSFYELH